MRGSRDDYLAESIGYRAVEIKVQLETPDDGQIASMRTHTGLVVNPGEFLQV